MNRREFFGMTAAAAPGAVLLRQDTTVARLQQPSLAGRPRSRITDYENDPFIVGIEKRLRCTCGCNLDIYTCRTTDFTCTSSPQLHREVIALVEQDKTGQEILDAFVLQHGETVLMAPPKEGFNWAGYLLPGVLITLTGSVLGWVLVRKTRARRLAVPVGERPGIPGLSPEDAERLQAELDRLDS